MYMKYIYLSITILNQALSYYYKLPKIYLVNNHNINYYNLFALEVDDLGNSGVSLLYMSVFVLE